MSVDQFESEDVNARKARPNDDAFRAATQLRCVLEQIREGFFAFDQDLRLVDINQLGELYLGFARADLLGQDLRDVIPATRETIGWDYYARVLRTGEVVDFTERSLTHRGVTVAIRAFPYEHGVGVILNNTSVSEEALMDRIWWRAFQAAARADPSLAIITLNVRGGIQAVDSNFCAMTGFSPDKLASLLLAEIIHPHERMLLARTINEVLRNSSPAVVNLNVMVRDGSQRRLKLALGSGGLGAVPDGIIVCVTDLGSDQAEDVRLKA